MTLFLSGLQFEGKPSISGPGASNVSYDFTCAAVSAANSDFPSTDALGVTIDNTRATALLA
jgi:hypothetical protein